MSDEKSPEQGASQSLEMTDVLADLLAINAAATVPVIYADGITGAHILDGVLSLCLVVKCQTPLPSGRNHVHFSPRAHIKLGPEAAKHLASLLGQHAFNAFAGGVEIEAPVSPKGGH